MMPAYTPAEARVLEDHYIAGYKAEGIWNSQKIKPVVRGVEKPANLREKMKVEQMNIGREAVYSCVAAGCSTVKEIRRHYARSETAVRRYLNELRAMGRVRQIGLTETQAAIWEITTL